MTRSLVNPIGFTKTGRPVFEQSTPTQKSRIAWRVMAERSTGTRKRRLGEIEAQALAGVPEPLQAIMEEVISSPDMNQAMGLTMGRWSDFKTPTRAMLAGAYLDARTRTYVNDRLDEIWRDVTEDRLPELDESYPEVVIGSGLHAAIYCAVRVQMGYEKPLVLEKRDRVGGAFAISRGPSFYMNSRNRPGRLSIPGEKGALNIVPGAMIQPSDLGGQEYQTNEALAWVIRTALAMYAEVVPNTEVKSLGTDESGFLKISLGEEDEEILAERVIIATGIGFPKNSTGLENPRIICFEEFMRMMGDSFPLREMNRVAVLGGGDSGKTAIEALTGQGPNAMSVASVDWPELIDWYGAPWENCEACADLARVRYKRLASLLADPSRPQRPFRVRSLPRTTAISGGFEVVYVNQKPYDYLIDCTGYIQNDLIKQDVTSIPLAVVDEIRVGRKVGEVVYIVGPAAELEVAENEREVLRDVQENKTSLFRYAPRTAALAASLD